ncbi:3',5'-cyclic adenosine monophosphate phosphodiesterase CpdA [Roseimaritima multifibrata]|uniref:3',5'-cyclic adenosine monophosphate phosphodiesterase CpdA n=1 Tax=Roseimaritima multifibrata TaxID=1930274 RepID=A0A517MLE7_9BACT|nr:metallophosphoesterase [Roseimaritima multifibrata]QDS95702.1 3',5'-cyclic adenosine monophosphate phosphodiesterase CpdA [Roseimaritima multifibrata]
MSTSPYGTTNGRRAFVKDGVLLLTAMSLGNQALSAPLAKRESVKIGLITDLHYADKPPGGSRHYRDTPAKLAQAGIEFQKEKPNFVVELGDLIDAASSVKTEQTYLRKINAEFSQVCPERYYVLGNHCVDTLHKEEFLSEVEQPKSFYSFDRGGYHFVVLDSCFRSDGQPYGRKNFTWTDANIPAEELEWLTADLEANSKPTIVFAHQRLDVSNNHGVKNCPEVRKVLEKSGLVEAVFQGHSHQNDLNEINGIHYCTMVAMVEGAGIDNNGFSLLNLNADGTIHLKGFHKQQAYDWK